MLAPASTESEVQNFEILHPHLETHEISLKPFRTMITHETSLTPADSPQTWSSGIFWHAEVESDVKVVEILEPDFEMKENHPN